MLPILRVWRGTMGDARMPDYRRAFEYNPRRSRSAVDPGEEILVYPFVGFGMDYLSGRFDRRVRAT